MSVGSDQCPGAKECPSGEDCFAEAAYERAREADVIVVNLHLLGAHVASGGYVLPEHDVVIVDEAHEAPDVMAGALGVTLTPAGWRRWPGWPGSALVRHRDSLDRVLTPLVGTRLARAPRARRRWARPWPTWPRRCARNGPALRGAPRTTPPSRPGGTGRPRRWTPSPPTSTRSSPPATTT